nr:hypothetical protein [Klebsiella pneumoniae subsp. pneumoniae]
MWCGFTGDGKRNNFLFWCNHEKQKAEGVRSANGNSARPEQTKGLKGLALAQIGVYPGDLAPRNGLRSWYK